MRSNYKRLGDYIRPCDEFNTGMEVKELLGIKNIKVFAKAKTNTIGINLEKYRIVRTGQFAFNRATTRNGDKISIALREGPDCIVSPSYRIFEVKDENELNPEYLMMWFRRPEFDRYARFKSHGSAHEFFGLEEMYEVELPVPPIEKQREIVREYNTIVNRIRLNEQLNQKLEETAQAIYRHWFVDFEFPMTREYAESIGKPELEGKPYRSSGGEMVYNEDLDQEIPVGWDSKQINNLVNYNYSNYSKDDTWNSIKYLDTGSITKNGIESIQTLIVGKDTIPSRAKRKVSHNDIVYSTVRPNLLHYGLIKHPHKNLLVSTGFVVIRSKDAGKSNPLIYQFITDPVITEYFQAKAEMSVATYPSIKPEDILWLWIPFPKDINILNKLVHILDLLYESIWNRNQENSILNKVTGLLHQRLSQNSAMPHEIQRR